MHAGIVSCPPDASFSEFARVMSEQRVHAVAVAEIGHGRPWGNWRFISDADLVAAVAAGREPTAREAASTGAATVSADAKLADAARVMAEQHVSHLVVLHESGGYPIGIISSLDIAAACSSAAGSDGVDEPRGQPA